MPALWPPGWTTGARSGRSATMIATFATEEFGKKLRHVHRNPVKRGLVSDPADRPWSSFRHYALRELGVVKIESEWTARDRKAKALAGRPGYS